MTIDELQYRDTTYEHLQPQFANVTPYTFAEAPEHIHRQCPVTAGCVTGLLLLLLCVGGEGGEGGGVQRGHGLPGFAPVRGHVSSGLAASPGCRHGGHRPPHSCPPRHATRPSRRATQLLPRTAGTPPLNAFVVVSSGSVDLDSEPNVAGTRLHRRGWVASPGRPVRACRYLHLLLAASDSPTVTHLEATDPSPTFTLRTQRIPTRAIPKAKLGFPPPTDGKPAGRLTPSRTSMGRGLPVDGSEVDGLRSAARHAGEG